MDLKFFDIFCEILAFSQRLWKTVNAKWNELWCGWGLYTWATFGARGSFTLVNLWEHRPKPWWASKPHFFFASEASTHKKFFRKTQSVGWKPILFCPSPPNLVAIELFMKEWEHFDWKQPIFKNWWNGLHMGGVKSGQSGSWDSVQLLKCSPENPLSDRLGLVFLEAVLRELILRNFGGLSAASQAHLNP